VVEGVATRSLLQDAIALALPAGITVYDAMYLTLAVRLETEVITGVDRFADKIAEHPLRKKSLSAFVVAKIFARAAWTRGGIGPVPRRMPSENAMSSGPHSANAIPGHLGVLEQAVKNFTTACQICAITPRRQHPFSFGASVSFIVRNSRARRVATHAAAGSQSDCRMSVQRSY
jgi:hypothetical protein